MQFCERSPQVRDGWCQQYGTMGIVCARILGRTDYLLILEPIPPNRQLITEAL